MHASILIITMSVVTIALRFIPFIVFSGKKEIPKIVIYLGEVLPSAVIGMLVIYCLKDIDFSVTPYGSRELVATFIVVLTQILSRNSLLSILAGTISYMLFLNFL
ncbi:branched-chain amino acid transporter AzlD [Campylobacter blaseri]|uniref:Branched-chain amino acid transporter AzlD n=2 Tax=Campylobacter blaseri TaxID=2042961 RepID=A0A2P8R1J5_9BACT|nr:branched-chain amino acid transporter AzlD [Campylobacter blaseri]PSM54135.1 branched-chain amino acid transporter AzlD [Campylobacter blaseri]